MVVEKVGSSNQGIELETKENKGGENAKDKNFEEYGQNVGLVFSRVDSLFIIFGNIDRRRSLVI